MQDRITTLATSTQNKNVLYLTQRDHRLHYNHSATFAYSLSTHCHLFIGTCPTRIKKNDLQHAFMVEGLIELSHTLSQVAVPFFVISDLETFIIDKNVSCVVTEFSPLRECIQFQNEIREMCVLKGMAMHVVDSHNIVPCVRLSEYCRSPRGVKIRLYKHWDECFVEMDELGMHEYNCNAIKKSQHCNDVGDHDISNGSKIDDIGNENNKDKNIDNNINNTKSINKNDVNINGVTNAGCVKSFLFDVNPGSEKYYCKINNYSSPKNATRYKGGASNGLKAVEEFIKRLDKYKKMRNCPDYDYISNLSPWIHSGQLGTAQILFTIMKHNHLKQKSDKPINNFVNDQGDNKYTKRYRVDEQIVNATSNNKEDKKAKQKNKKTNDESKLTMINELNNINSDGDNLKSEYVDNNNLDINNVDNINANSNNADGNNHLNKKTNANITNLKGDAKSYQFGDENFDAFVNEIFVWKETAEHFCYHEKNYDKIQGGLDWAQETLKIHAKDKREHIYSLQELEKAKTYDDEWNAGQKEMVLDGKMHGYVRMYWAKKLLTWTRTPEEALSYAVYLNDKYTIDGNDPNGYLGIMWSICGAMDQGWKEREIYGKIRGMSGIKAKIYVAKWKQRNIK